MQKHPFPPARFPRLRQRAFSLVEAAVAIGLFALLAGGIIATTLTIRATAEETVYQNTALIIGQAYLEQIRSIEYATLLAAARDTSGSVGLFLKDSSGTTLKAEDGSIMNNRDWAMETIMLDENEAGIPIQPMNFRFRPMLNDLNSATGNVADGVEIIVYYSVSYNFGLQKQHNGSLRTVRSNVATY